MKSFLTLTLAALLVACGPSQPNEDAVSTQVALLMQQSQPESPAEVQAPPQDTSPGQGPGPQAGVLLPAVPNDARCVPPSTLRVMGTVMEVTSGHAAMVRIDGQLWVVRYIGVDSGDMPSDTNAELVLGKEVMLISDEVDIDEGGRLPRYVIAGGVFVNLELVRRNAANAEPKDLNTACDDVFAQAEAQR